MFVCHLGRKQKLLSREPGGGRGLRVCPLRVCPLRVCPLRVCPEGPPSEGPPSEGPPSEGLPSEGLPSAASQHADRTAAAALQRFTLLIFLHTVLVDGAAEKRGNDVSIGPQEGIEPAAQRRMSYMQYHRVYQYHGVY